MKSHWPLAIVAILALSLALANLGSDYLWEDEGDTAVLAMSILKCGVPKAWDGTTFSDSDKGARVNDKLVMVSHPWVQYYVAAASFFLFGENTFAARLPFALAGWLTVLLSYAFVWRITASRGTALSAAVLVVLSVQFLLFARQCRNYSINMLLTLCLILIFFRMKSLRDGVLFAVAAILLFHTTPLGIVPVGVFGILTILYRPFVMQRRGYWFALPIILIATVPWLALARSGYGENTLPVDSIGGFFARLTQYAIECASVTPVLGCIFLLAICFFQYRSQKRDVENDGKAGRFFEKDEAALFLVTLTLLLSYGLAIAATQPGKFIWLLGLRFVPVLIPLIAMIAAILVAKVCRGRFAIALALLCIFGFTNLAALTPWIFAEEKAPIGKDEIGVHAQTKLVDRFFNTGLWLFLGDLWRENPGTVGKTCKFLQQFAKPGDVLITNYEWEPLYFHTRMPQALKILRDYPVYEAARRQGLPEYVFGVDHVRWVVWRLSWEGNQGYWWNDVEGRILLEGGRLTQVAELEDTLWENRENIHTRRFSGERYLYPWPGHFPPAGIFRVDWPGDASRSASN